jgi:superfamily II DNA helicase RecQ
VLAALAHLADQDTGEFSANPSELARMLDAFEDDARAWLASAEAVGAAELFPGSSQLWRGRIKLRRLGADRAEEVRLRARKIDGGRWDRLDSAQAFAAGDSCRRLTLLRYFGDQQEPIADGRCCDVCSPIDYPAETAATRTRSKRKAAAPPIPDDVPEDLLIALKAWRSAAAKEAGVPAYVIGKDATLHAIAATRPATSDALSLLPGVGPAFLERHATAVLAVLADHPGGALAA